MEGEAIEKLLLHKCDSLPQLLVGETLLEELGVEWGRKSAMSLNDLHDHDDLDTERSMPNMVSH